jgi:hypothetical protein
LKKSKIVWGLGRFEYLDLWQREVVPIFEFNRMWRLFRENEQGYSPEEQFIRALSLFADNTDNCRFRYWLVREHAGHLVTPGEDEQASLE